MTRALMLARVCSVNVPCGAFSIAATMVFAASRSARILRACA